MRHTYKEENKLIIRQYSIFITGHLLSEVGKLHHLSDDRQTLFPVRIIYPVT